ncbi:MAG: hypothetical protein U9R57_10195, partial [Thermodesulfobacteriota bacterium]|nr:hypothetical protein [Thermodesulfobacteriota bacterium]
MKKQITIHLLMSLVFVMVVAQAHALVLTPENADWWGDAGPGVPAIYDQWNDLIAADGGTLTVGASTELYKMDVGAAADEGSFASSYDTVFSMTDTDPQNALITYVPGTDWINSNPTYLLVKDGNQNPDWYGFDISGWDGQETISAENFWPGNGS